MSLKAGFHSGIIGSDWTFFPLVLSAQPDQSVENISALYYPGCRTQIQSGTENWYRKPMRGFKFVPIRSDPMLIFLSGNQPLQYIHHLFAYLWYVQTKHRARPIMVLLYTEEFFIRHITYTISLCKIHT